MYLNVDQGISRELLQRAKATGLDTVILTIDAVGTEGKRLRYVPLVVAANSRAFHDRSVLNALALPVLKLP